MATLFGRPLNTLVKALLVSGGQSAVLGGIQGYVEARHNDDDHPYIAAAKKAASWTAMDFVVEPALWLVAPNLREGSSPLKNAMISSAIGGTSGLFEGYAEAKLKKKDDPLLQGLITGGEWAAADLAIEYANRSLWPALWAKLTK